MGYEFYKEKIIFPSTPVLGINNDQSLKLILSFNRVTTNVENFENLDYSVNLKTY